VEAHLSLGERPEHPADRRMAAERSWRTNLLIVDEHEITLCLRDSSLERFQTVVVFLLTIAKGFDEIQRAIASRLVVQPNTVGNPLPQIAPAITQACQRFLKPVMPISLLRVLLE
jgi:hypothetical protein